MINWIAGLFTAEHSSEWISGLTGAGGAILGSMVTILWTEWFNKRSAKRETQDRLHVGAFGALNRLNTIYSDMMVVRDHLAEGFINAHKYGADNLTLVVRPMNRLGEPTRFTLDELRTLNAIGGSKLLSAVDPIDRVHNVVLDVMEMYRTSRTKIWDQLPIKASADGRAVFELTAEQLEQFKPRMHELDEYLEKAHEFSSDLVDSCYFAMLLFVRARKLPFSRRFSLTLTRPDGSKVVLRVPKKRWLGARLARSTRKRRRQFVCRVERWRRARRRTAS